MKSPFAQPEKTAEAIANPARATKRIVSSKSDTREERPNPPRRQGSLTRGNGVPLTRDRRRPPHGRFAIDKPQCVGNQQPNAES
jgi:hypothetical protein